MNELIRYNKKLAFHKQSNKIQTNCKLSHNFIQHLICNQPQKDIKNEIEERNSKRLIRGEFTKVNKCNVRA